MNRGKIKIISLLICAGIIALTAVSCSRNTAQEPQKGPELVFSISQTTRAVANYPIADYFEIDDNVAVTADEFNSIYIHNNGLLEYGSGDIIIFPAYNQPLENVELMWSDEDSYSVDQTTKEAFLKSDVLVCSFSNLMPATLVPVEFSHVNYKLTFTLGGANAGKKIGSLSIADGADTFEAYCDADNNDAQLILLSQKNLARLSGSLTIDGEIESYRFVMPVYTVPAGGMLNQNITVTIIL